jgi:hypothetical protein
MHPMNDIVVVIPGILGSVLQKDGKDIWALSRRSRQTLVDRWR